MSHDFKTSLAVGKAGESLIASILPDLIKLDSRKSDFAHKITGELYELKTDSYDMDKTPNFFIEHWSDEKRGKLGGPRQSQKHGTKYFMYLFKKNSVMFIFDVDALVDWVNANIEKYKPIAIQNKTWVTIGYRIPRADLAHLVLDVVNLDLALAKKAANE